MKNGKYFILFTAIMLCAAVLTSCKEHIHEFGEWTTVKEPSCAIIGLEERSCSVCGFTETGIIKKSEKHKYYHSAGKVVKEPTCTESGTKQYVCSVCGNIKTEKLLRKGHRYDIITEQKEQTCSEYGLLTITCSICGDTFEEETRPLGHNFDENNICTICGYDASELSE